MHKIFAEQYFTRQLFALWVMFSLLLLFAQWREISIFQMGDADDHLRMAQVRDWLAGQNWFDVTQYRINPPDGGPMHWSRLVDVPIAAMVLILRLFLDPVLAEQVAVAIVPLFTLAFVLWLTASISKRLFDHKTALLAAAAILAIPPMINQLLPMRIDHHGWQLVLFLTCLFALIDKAKPVRAAIILGFAAAMWLEISVESLPFIILFLGLLALRWIVPKLRAENFEAERQFPIAMASVAVSTAALYLLTEGFQLSENFCDALSPFHIAALAAIALIINGAVWGSRLAGAELQIVAKLIVSVVAAVAGVGCVIAIAPQCAGDAFTDLDPVVREYWFNRTPEGLPLWDLGWRYRIQPLTGFLVGILGFIYLFRWNTTVAMADKIILGLLFLGTMLIGLYVSRASVYALCLANIVVASAAIKIFAISDERAGLWSRMTLRIMATLLMVPTLFGPILYQIIIKRDAAEIVGEEDEARQSYRKAFACHAFSNIAALDRLQPARIMTGLDVSPSVLHYTDLKVVATGHHRNQLAMKDVILTFTGTPETARAIMKKRGIEYLIGCNGSPELDYYGLKAGYGFWQKLQAGARYDWLEPQPMIGPYQIWRIRPDGE